MATPMWLDCDPGHDDAMAILLAAHSPRVRLIGISTVSGNQTVEKTTINALKMAGVAGVAGLPIVQGADRPLIREAKHDAKIHGESGLAGSEILDGYQTAAVAELSREHREAGGRYRPRENKALAVMRTSIMRSKDKVNLVATGALTNVALLARCYPEVLENVKQIVLMGGALGIGNRHPVAEFNILCDPEAAAIVFTLPVEVVMVPLEVTHTALVTEGVLSRISAELEGSALSVVVTELMTFFKKTYLQEFNFTAPPLHDPCAVAYCIAPEIFKAKRMRVDVVHGEHLVAGQTVCDIWDSMGRPKNAVVALAMDVPRFWDLMVDALKSCNAACPLNSSKL
ncbi:Inosine-uridine-preferring nucleoside hydrolase-like protein [Diplonema papillatum]|nr:Inosine-uridine-preferring nucleoside hydrolase-like protein [Diplonema papillatum]